MILRLMLLAALLYGVVPYYSLYRFNHALVIHDHEDMSRYLDLHQLRQHYKESLRISQSGGEGAITRMFRGTANTMSALTVDQLVTMDWIRRKLVLAEQGQIGQSMFERLDHAFFEGPNTFLVRLGRLGEEPLHLLFRRDGLVWRLSALYG